METETLVVAHLKEGMLEKFMQDPDNAKVIEESGHKQETTIMSVCSD